MTEMWITNEHPARVLFVKGRSGLDPDCLVAYLESGDWKPLWIVDDQSKTENAAVCGLPGDVRARRIPTSNQTEPSK